MPTISCTVVDVVGTLRFAHPTILSRLRSSVRHAITSPSTSSAAASRNGAPGIFTGAWSLMKYANVSVNRNGPSIWAMLLTLLVAPCNWPC